MLIGVLKLCCSIVNLLDVIGADGLSNISWFFAYHLEWVILILFIAVWVAEKFVFFPAIGFSFKHACLLLPVDHNSRQAFELQTWFRLVKGLTYMVAPL